MKNKFAKIAFILLIVVTVCILAACDKDNGPAAGEYTIQYADDSGVRQITVRTGEVYSIDYIPSKKGNDFLGLFDAGGTQYVLPNGSSLGSFTDNCNLVLFPKFEPKKYKLALDLCGGESNDAIDVIDVSYGDTVPADLPTDIQKSHYKFAGWYTKPNKQGKQVYTSTHLVAANATITETRFDLSDPDNMITLYAGYTGDTCTVTLHIDGAIETHEVEYGTPVSAILSDRRTADGWAVYTWSLNEDKTGIFRGNITNTNPGGTDLYAVDYAPVIEFETEGGNEIAPIIAETGSWLNIPVPEKEGYTFEAWYTTSGTKFTETNMPSKSIKLIAHWNATLTFDANGGTFMEISQPQGTRITLPTPEKEGYMFAGWYDGDNVYTSTTMPSVSKKLTARYYTMRSQQYVIVDKDTSVGSYSSTPSYPSMSQATHRVDLTDLYEQGVRQVKITAHYTVYFEGIGDRYSSSPATASMAWYCDDYADDDYKLWSYTDSFENGETTHREEEKTKTINLVSKILYVCRYGDTGYSNNDWYPIWTDFWLDIEYPNLQSTPV